MQYKHDLTLVIGQFHSYRRTIQNEIMILFFIFFILFLCFDLSQCMIIRLYLFCEENDFKHFDFLSIYQNVLVTDVHRN